MARGLPPGAVRMKRDRMLDFGMVLLLVGNIALALRGCR